MIFLFNYIKIGLWSLIYNYITHDEIIIDIIIDNIKESGCVAIKFSQWLIPLYEELYHEMDTEIISKLEDLYDKCNIHSIENTEKLYYKDFLKDLHEDYEIIDIISSGSIGQVYKVSDKKTKEICAMKVIHPDINKELYYFEKIIHGIYSISCSKNWFIQKFPIDLSLFIKNFKQQTNMEHEAYNCDIFYERYKYSENIVIPRVIKFSENILFMDYEESNKLHSSELSSYKKTKFLSFMMCFLHINQFDLKFMHGDIHNGNWGIRNNNNKEELVIYDFGFCWWIRGMSNKDIEAISYFITDRLLEKEIRIEDQKQLIKRLINILLSNENTIRLDKEIDKYINNHGIEDCINGDVNSIIKTALDFSKKNKIFINLEILQVLIICSQYRYNFQRSINKLPMVENIKELFCISEKLIPGNLYSKYLQGFLNKNKQERVISSEISDNIDILKNLII